MKESLFFSCAALTDSKNLAKRTVSHKILKGLMKLL